MHSTLCKALRHLNAGPKAHGKLTWAEFKALQVLEDRLSDLKLPVTDAGPSQYQRISLIVDRDENGYPKPEAVNLSRAVQ